MKQTQMQLTEEALRNMTPEQMNRLVLAIFDRKNPGARKAKVERKRAADTN